MVIHKHASEWRFVAEREYQIPHRVGSQLPLHTRDHLNHVIVDNEAEFLTVKTQNVES